MSSAVKDFPSSRVGKYIQLLGLLLALGVVGYSYMKKRGIGLDLAGQFSRHITSPSKVRIFPLSVKEGAPTRSPEQVRPVIVSVKTSWSRGTGFFIRENFIITSKQVIEPDLEKLAALQKKVHRNRELLGFEGEKLDSYRVRLKKKGRGSLKDALKLLISERERYLADFRFRQEGYEQRLAQQEKAHEYPALKIVLADGSEQSASLVQVSQDYDLALLSLTSGQKSPALTSPPLGFLLRLGDSVVIPVGAEERLTTGTFAGYRRVGVQNRMFLQVDAEISQDQRGGPVLDAAGYVRGVATRTVRDGKEVGFAIPIERVFDEFAAALQ